MGVLIDTRPLRELPQYRRLWIGQSVNALGSMITSATLPYQVFQLTRSSVAVGLLGVCQLVPLVTFAVIGGTFADSIDKRKLMLGSAALSTAVCGLLLLNASLSDPHLWVLYVLASLSMASAAFNFPAIRSLVPRLVPPELRPSAYGLQSITYTIAMTAGPALAGLLITRSVQFAYGADLLTYCFAMAAFAGLAPSPPAEGAKRASAGSLVDGVRFLHRSPMLLSVLSIDFLAMVFGMPRALFPALTERLGGGPILYGLLLGSVAAGGFIGTLTSGWSARVRRHGIVVLVAVAVWGTAIAAAGFATAAIAVLVLFAAAGAADALSAMFRTTIAADITPDAMRGRISGVEGAVYGGGPALGDVEAGVVGGLLGLQFAIVSGGLVCIVAAIVFAVAVPTLRRYVRADVGAGADEAVTANQLGS